MDFQESEISLAIKNIDDIVQKRIAFLLEEEESVIAAQLVQDWSTIINYVNYANEVSIVLALFESITKKKL